MRVLNADGELQRASGSGPRVPSCRRVWVPALRWFRPDVPATRRYERLAGRFRTVAAERVQIGTGEPLAYRRGTIWAPEDDGPRSAAPTLVALAALVGPAPLLAVLPAAVILALANDAGRAQIAVILSCSSTALSHSRPWRVLAALALDSLAEVLADHPDAMVGISVVLMAALALRRRLFVRAGLRSSILVGFVPLAPQRHSVSRNKRRLAPMCGARTRRLPSQHRPSVPMQAIPI